MTAGRWVGSVCLHVRAMSSLTASCSLCTASHAVGSAAIFLLVVCCYVHTTLLRCVTLLLLSADVVVAANISAAAVSALRKKTGAGMMDCKKALTECGGDADKAVEV